MTPLRCFVPPQPSPHTWWLLLAALFVSGACGDTTPSSATHDYDNIPEDVGPEVVADIDTVVSSSPTAGEPLDVRCRYLNPVGNPVEPEPEALDHEVVLAYPDIAFLRDDDELLPLFAGAASVACQNQQLGLTDTDPAELEIEPGPPVTTRLQFEQHQVTAGERIEADCVGFDTFGNPVDDADFELGVDTSGDEIEMVDGELAAEITDSGIYSFSCHTEDTEQHFGDIVEVLPAKPAELYVDPTPDQEVYTTGHIITVGALVYDRFGNRIPAPELDYDAGSGSELLGEGRFRFPIEGTYTVTTEVNEPTHEGKQLREEFDIVVNDSGPGIDCLEPANGEMLNHTPGQSLTFEGMVTDDFDVDQVEVDGQFVDVDADGSFSTTIQPDYGINFVGLVATDEYDEQNVQICSFLVSDNYANENLDLDEAVSLELKQNAVDDGVSYSPWGNPQTLSHLMEVILNSHGFRDMLDEGLQEDEPYPLSAGCSYDVYIDNFDFVGDNHTTGINLINGGLHLIGGDGDESWDTNTLIHDTEIELDIRHPWRTCPNYSTTATVEWLSVDLEADIDLTSSGNVDISLGNVEVNSGHIGLSGWVGSAIEFFAQNTLRDNVEELVEEAVSESFDDLLDDMMTSIDTYSTTFDVPRLDGGGDIPMTFEVGLDQLDFDEGGAEIVVDADMDVDHTGGDMPPEASVSRGIAYPAPGNDFSGSVSGLFSHAGGTAHVVLLNKALHELWRAGLLHADLSDTISDIAVDVPDGAAVELEAGLPPVVAFDDAGGVELQLGATRLQVQYPGIFDVPVSFDVGVIASTDLDMSFSDEIEFPNVTVEQFYFSSPEVSIDGGTQQVLAEFLMALMEDVVDETLNAALPAIPIPSFTIPDTIAGTNASDFNLDPGSDLGLVNGTANQTDTHIEITAEFGIQ